MNKQGSLIATCSEKGTLIRFWDARTGELWHEVRRGSTPAKITSLAFDKEGKFLTCCRSAKSIGSSTVHIFKVP
jgi:WD40 repeat protein